LNLALPLASKKSFVSGGEEKGPTEKGLLGLQQLFKRGGPPPFNRENKKLPLVKNPRAVAPSAKEGKRPGKELSTESSKF